MQMVIPNALMTTLCPARRCYLHVSHSSCHCTWKLAVWQCMALQNTEDSLMRFCLCLIAEFLLGAAQQHASKQNHLLAYCEACLMLSVPVVQVFGDPFHDCSRCSCCFAPRFHDCHWQGFPRHSCKSFCFDTLTACCNFLAILVSTHLVHSVVGAVSFGV